MKKNRAFTLMEIMIVIFLIGIIGGVIGYNMRGTINRGRAFKTEQAIRQLKDILEMEIASGEVTRDQVIAEPEIILRRSQLVKDPVKLLTDGWNVRFIIQADDRSPDRIRVISEALNHYQAHQRELAGQSNQPVTEVEED